MTLPGVTVSVFEQPPEPDVAAEDTDVGSRTTLPLGPAFAHAATSEFHVYPALHEGLLPEPPGLNPPSYASVGTPLESKPLAVVLPSAVVVCPPEVELLSTHF